MTVLPELDEHHPCCCFADRDVFDDATDDVNLILELVSQRSRAIQNEDQIQRWGAYDTSR